MKEHVEPYADSKNLSYAFIETDLGRNVLHLAVEVGSKEISSFLISIDEQLVEMKDGFGWTPLHYVYIFFFVLQ